MATEQNVRGFFLFSILNGKHALVQKLNRYGYNVSNSSTVQELADLMYKIYVVDGSYKISQIIEGIQIDATKISQDDLREIKKDLNDSTNYTSTAESKNILTTLLDLWTGTSSQIGDTVTTTTTPTISPMAVTGIVVVSLIVIIIIAFKK